MKIDKTEVLRYLGHKDQIIDTEMDRLIDSCINECESTAKPAYTYKVFDMPISEIIPLSGESIAEHLSRAKKAVIMAATLGIHIDSTIRMHQISNLTKAFILDACATDLIEKVCDSAQEEIFKAMNMAMNFRFSPGYGDLPLSIQPNIISVLNADRAIGLTVSESLILLPRKSVTAIWGLFDNEIKKDFVKPCHKCAECNILNCAYRKI